MDYDYLRIDIDAMRSEASEIKSINNDIMNDFNQLFEELQMLDNMWDGPANEAFSLQVQQDKEFCCEFSKSIAECASHLEKALNEYGKCENEIFSYIRSLNI